MKKLISLLAIGLMLSGVSFAYDSPTDNGQILTNSTGGGQATPIKVYQLVRYGAREQNTATLASGSTVVWDTVSKDGVTIALTTTSGNGAVAGVTVTQIFTGNGGGTSASDDAGRRNWGYVQVYGPVDATVTAGGVGGVTAGAPAITSSSSGSVGSFDLNNSDATKPAAEFGYFMEGPADGSDTSVKIFVQAM